MKKRQLFKLSEEGVALINQFGSLADLDDSHFYNPSAKKLRLMETVRELQDELGEVGRGESGFDGVAKLAATLMAQCNADEAKPQFDQTKEQVLLGIVGRIRAVVTDELMGKNVCLKHGPKDFRYFKVSEVRVVTNEYYTLGISFHGIGFETFPGMDKGDGKSMPTFGRMYGNGKQLVMTGKDAFYDEWLYVLTDAEMKVAYEKTVADMAKVLKIAGY